MELQSIYSYVDNFSELNDKENFYEINNDVDNFEYNYLDKYFGNVFILAKIYLNQTHKNDEFIEFNETYEALVMLSIVRDFIDHYNEETGEVFDYEGLFKSLHFTLKSLYQTVPDQVINTFILLGYDQESIKILIDNLEDD